MGGVDASRPVILVGMMGSGKSTVGRRLAAALGRDFIDADREIEERCGVPVSTIFELEGEDGFRRRETALLDELTRRRGLVLATGGGAVLVEANRDWLRERGFVVYLVASTHELWLRLRNDKSRPLLRTADPRGRIDQLVEQREPLYRECAHLIVATGRQPVDHVIDEILGRLGQPEEAVREIEVSLGERSYRIAIGEGLLRRADLLAPFVAGRQVAIVTNPTVGRLYGAEVVHAAAQSASEVIEVVLSEGEEQKNWLSLNLILDALLARRFDRKSVIVALGGGVIGDIAGFAAAVYQRGIEFIQVPTTLLAQVDSSVGGKTAINHPLGKNMIGAFHQPRLVVADVACLASLPERELSAGLAEVIKHGAIADPDYLGAVERLLPAVFAHDAAALGEVVEGSCRIKSRVVAADEREGGVRATLNFGHTFGHAIEAGLGYGKWLHGEAVGAGMVMAADLSCRLGLLDEVSRARLVAAIGAARLPVRGPQWPADRYLELMSVDKKAERGTPRFVVLEALGRARVQRAPDDAVRATLAACGS